MSDPPKHVAPLGEYAPAGVLVRPCGRAVLLVRAADLAVWQPKGLDHARCWVERKAAEAPAGAPAPVHLFAYSGHGAPPREQCIARTSALHVGAQVLLDVVEAQFVVDLVALTWIDADSAQRHAIQSVHVLGCLRNARHESILRAFLDRYAGAGTGIR